MSPDDTTAVTITITENGPYLVSPALPLSEQALSLAQEGSSWDYEPRTDLETGAHYALCRCGQSSNKPFCDGTHAHVGFHAH
jgi:CDGSH-type Zn-finger protein